MKYFKIDEFDCPCCGENRMQEAFLNRLDSARDLAQTPFIINSGFRCEKHNKEVGGTEASAHMKGRAADISINNSRERFVIVSALLEVGFNRLRVANTFIHVDIDKNKVNNVLWLK